MEWILFGIAAAVAVALGWQLGHLLTSSMPVCPDARDIAADGDGIQRVPQFRADDAIDVEYGGLDSSFDPVWNERGSTINPATGLPMVSGDASGVDVAGNPYGFDHDDYWGTSDLGGIDTLHGSEIGTMPETLFGDHSWQSSSFSSIEWP